MKKIWILVANRTEAKVFECWSLKAELRVVKTFSNPCITESEKVSQDSDSEAFARYLSSVIEGDRVRGHFDDLLLVAEPGFLGKLRTHFDRRRHHSGQLRAVNKELVHIPTRNLRLHLADVLVDMMRAPRQPAVSHRPAQASA